MVRALVAKGENWFGFSVFTGSYWTAFRTEPTQQCTFPSVPTPVSVLSQTSQNIKTSRLPVDGLELDYHLIPTIGFYSSEARRSGAGGTRMRAEPPTDAKLNSTRVRRLVRTSLVRGHREMVIGIAGYKLRSPRALPCGYEIR
jgi:hypothetical protein